MDVLQRSQMNAYGYDFDDDEKTPDDEKTKE